MQETLFDAPVSECWFRLRRPVEGGPVELLAGRRRAGEGARLWSYDSYDLLTPQEALDVLGAVLDGSWG